MGRAEGCPGVDGSAEGFGPRGAKEPSALPFSPGHPSADEWSSRDPGLAEPNEGLRGIGGTSWRACEGPPWFKHTNLDWLGDASRPLSRVALRQAPIRSGRVGPDGHMLCSPEGVP